MFLVNGIIEISSLTFIIDINSDHNKHFFGKCFFDQTTWNVLRSMKVQECHHQSFCFALKTHVDTVGLGLEAEVLDEFYKFGITTIFCNHLKVTG